MTPLELMRRRRMPLRLVIYDCDGVLVDSEAISSRLVAEELTTLGWTLSAGEAERRFIGTSLPDMVPVVERQLGRKLPDDWQETLAGRIALAQGRDAVAIAGAVEALAATTAMGLSWRVASNSSHAEMRAKFARIGISAMVEGRVHSFEDVARGKPAPDLFLAAARAAGAEPGNCLVIEDSVAGVTGAVAAGMDCLGLAATGDGTALRLAGAVPFASMFDLPALLAAAARPLA